MTRLCLYENELIKCYIYMWTLKMIEIISMHKLKTQYYGKIKITHVVAEKHVCALSVHKTGIRGFWQS